MRQIAREMKVLRLSSSLHFTALYLTRKYYFMLEIPRVYPTGLGTRGCVEDPRITRTGFRPDPYTDTVFAGPGTGRPKGTRGYTRVHPYFCRRPPAITREFSFLCDISDSSIHLRISVTSESRMCVGSSGGFFSFLFHRF
jgi:hypothetical protein